MGAKTTTLPEDRFQSVIIDRFKAISDVRTSANRITSTYFIFLVSPLYGNETGKLDEELADFSIFLHNGAYKATYARPYKHMIATVILPEVHETREQALDALIQFIEHNLIKTTNAKVSHN